MGKFLKNFGLGLIFMICSPILACLVVIGGAIGILYFVLASLRIVFRFFRGLKPIKELEIDARVETIKKRLDLSLATEPASQPQPEKQPIYVTQNYYQAPPQAPQTQIPQAPQNQAPQQVSYAQNPEPQPFPSTQNPSADFSMGPDIFDISEETSEITFEEDEDE